MTPSKLDLLQGTLDLMVLQTLATMGSLHGYGIARRIEQVSGNRLVVQYGTLYPALLRLEQEGYIASEWGVSDNNRRARFYKLTRAGRRQLAKESERWEKATSILARRGRCGNSARPTPTNTSRIDDGIFNRVATTATAAITTNSDTTS